MPRKAAAKSRKPAKSQYVDKEGRPCLPENQLWRWRALSAELNNAGLQYQIAVGAMQAALDAHPAVAEARVRLLNSQAANLAAAKALAELQKDISNATGLNLTQCSIDDETGLIHEHVVSEDPPASSPLKTD